MIRSNYHSDKKSFSKTESLDCDKWSLTIYHIKYNNYNRLMPLSLLKVQNLPLLDADIYQSLYIVL